MNDVEGAPDLVLTGRFERDAEKTYHHFPFEVPDGADAVRIRLSYNNRISSDPFLEGGNTLDLGLFDQRGTDTGSPGFRGWSGSVRSDISISEFRATPPYRPGPIEPGVWHALLGLYKVGADGVDYRLELWFTEDECVVAPELPPLTLPAVDRRPPSRSGWLRGDLHCHSLRSDGDSTPAEVMRAAAAQGLDFVGLTDHNTPAIERSDRVSTDGPVLIPATEVTTYGGHWNVWGVRNWYEFRQPNAVATKAAMGQAVDDGAFVSVNHPKPFGPEWSYGVDLGYQAIEVWNGPWGFLNPISLAWWDEHLRRGQRVVAVGGSDTHYLRDNDSASWRKPKLGQPTTWLNTHGERTLEAILDALRRGDLFLSATPDGPELYLDVHGENVMIQVVAGQGSTLVAITDAGAVAAWPIGSEPVEKRMPFPADSKYLRIQVIDQHGNVLALSNPVWRDGIEPVSVENGERR